MLWLVKNGVPWDVANTLPSDELMAMGIVFGEFDGGTFDWDAGTWKRQSR